MIKETFLKYVLVFIAGTFLNFSAIAGDYPNKPIKLYIGFKAGGGTDTVGRVLAKAREELGQQVQVVNRPGAGEGCACNC